MNYVGLFTALDLASEYNQLTIKEKNRHKKAFITRDSFFEFNAVLFESVNTPFSFQDAMAY